MERILGDRLVGPAGNVATVSITNIKFKLLLFAASWCPPCRGLVPNLRELYQQANQGGKQLEIVWVSKDRNLDEFNTMKTDMPWLSVPFEPAAITKLTEHYEIQGLPKLLLIDEGGVVVHDDCRANVLEKGIACLADWEELLD